LLLEATDACAEIDGKVFGGDYPDGSEPQKGQFTAAESKA
jgi:hypothetical protein